MKRSKRLLLYPTMLILAASVAGCSPGADVRSGGEPAPAASEPQTSNGTAAPSPGSGLTEPKPSRVMDPLDWTMPSGGEYPKIEKGDPVWIDVSIADQRIYIKKGDQTIYTMVTSSGLDTQPETSTPRGIFYVEPERGEWFFAPQYQEGAKYWVSWKNHGEFLFHSVVMDKNGQVIEEEAKKLGQKASHGCFRLTIPDAKWIYENIPVNTKVVIRD